MCLAALALGIVGCNPLPETVDEKESDRSVVNSVDEIVNDMKPPHEGYPHGVPESLDWFQRPRVGMGNTPPTDWLAFTAWGQLYEDVDENPATNTRVQIRSIKAYILSKRTNQWTQLQSSVEVSGAAYAESFEDDRNIPADIRQETDGGGISVTSGNGFNFHFWPPNRATIDPTDIAGVFTTVEARLILNDSTKPDDRATARYILSMGADYWKSLDAQWDYWKTNSDAVIGKFKYVRNEWRAFNAHTLSEEALRSNPPPTE